MTIQLLWQGFVMACAILLPALTSFAVGTTSSLVNDRWGRFKILWAVSTALGFAAAAAMLWALQSEFLGSWLLIAGCSALINFVAYALGARLANPTYQPEGKNPLGLAIEFVVIATVSAAAGLIWSILPGGQPTGWIFGALLWLEESYIFFLFDDRPKGMVGEDIPLLIMSFVIEAAVLIVVTFCWWIVHTILWGTIAFANITSARAWMNQGGLFLTILLVLWTLVNLILWWLNRELEEKIDPKPVLT